MKRNLFSLMAFNALSLFVFTVKAQTTTSNWLLSGNSNAANSSKLGTTNLAPIRFVTNNAERMRLDSTGRLGIGTVNPAARLDVSVNYENLVARFNANQGKMYIGLAKYGVIKGYVGSVSGGADDVDLGTTYTNPSGSVHLAIRSTPVLTINPAGGVGIGTKNIGPGLRLTVAGPSVFSGYMSIQEGGLYVNNTQLGSTGIYSTADIGVSGSSNWEIGYGVYGEAFGKEGCGVVAQSLNSVGLLATTANDSSYAGFFNGDIFVNGNYTGSDKALKSEIQEVSNAMDIINRLQPKSYSFKHEGAYKIMNLPKGRHYGLIAQEVEQVLPELVKTTKYIDRKMDTATRRLIVNEAKQTEFKALNYTELIPLTIKALQEQEKTIKEQQAQINELKELVNKLLNGNSQLSILSGSLEQNAPNPYNGSSVIRYRVPQSAGIAQLVISDAKGIVLKTIALNNKGAGQVTLDSGSLAAGAYNYSLFIDNKLVDTRQMVITK